MEKNEKGHLLMALLPAFREASGNPLKRYNGGWTKTITGLDKSNTNGYSLIGAFEPHPGSLAWRAPGLYLDCDIDGSRKNQVNDYRLFALDAEGVVTQLGETLRYSPDWAVKLWPAIEAWFKAPLPLLPVEADDPPATTPETEAPAVLRSSWTDEMLQHEIALCQTELDRRAKERARAATFPVPETLTEDDNAIPEGGEEALQDMFDAFADDF